VKPRRFLAHVAFAFFLLLAQQLGAAHAISHFSSDNSSSRSHEKQLPAEMQCAQCLAFAAVGSALNGAPPAFCATLQLSEMLLAAPLTIHLPSLIRAFNSRAPPVAI
jgi:hypothetical protein